MPAEIFDRLDKAPRAKTARGVNLAFAYSALVLFLTSCAGSLPSLEGRNASQAFSDTADTRLGRALSAATSEHPGLSGIVPLADGRDALAARILLADAAEKSIDVQVYIWHGDLSGTLLLKALHRAALRGVRVRLLLDDNGTHLDETLAALNAHPLIEVRLFNPFTYRRWPWINYLTDFKRVNRRMHNKAFVVDNQAAIVGGRNIGDEYFDAGQSTLFIDLDVIAIGQIVPQVSADFDRYWASDSAFPIERLVEAPDEKAIDRLSQKAEKALASPQAQDYREALLTQGRLVEAIDAQTLEFDWARTQLVSDDPAKGLGEAPEEKLIGARLLDKLGTPKEELELVSAYFVPTETGVEALGGLARSGVHVHVLTNSLAATDVPAVHAGYGKRRRALLEAGVALYEMKRSPTAVRSSPSDRGPLGSSSASLHAKTFSLDRQKIFVGSFNFDPRSLNYNTEMGLVIESPKIAGKISDLFAHELSSHVYKLRLSPEGELQWIEEGGNSAIVHTTEPDTPWWRRLGVRLLSWLPIEHLL